MAKIATMITAATISGALAISFVPVAAEAQGKGAKTTASSASKTRPGASKYSKKTTKRAPARTAASVLNQRARNEGARNIVAYKSAKRSISKTSSTRQMGKGKPAKAINNVSKPGILTRIGNWFSSLFSGKPKAAPRKVTFRDQQRPSAELQRLVRLPNGKVGQRP